MFRIGITCKNAPLEAKNFDTKKQCEEWLLSIAERKEVVKAMIVNKANVIKLRRKL